jgi:hypothetical protein
MHRVCKADPLQAISHLFPLGKQKRGPQNPCWIQTGPLTLWWRLIALVPRIPNEGATHKSTSILFPLLEPKKARFSKVECGPEARPSSYYRPRRCPRYSTVTPVWTTRGPSEVGPQDYNV